MVLKIFSRRRPSLFLKAIILLSLAWLTLILLIEYNNSHTSSGSVGDGEFNKVISSNPNNVKSPEKLVLLPKDGLDEEEAERRAQGVVNEIVEDSNINRVNSNNNNDKDVNSNDKETNQVIDQVNEDVNNVENQEGQRVIEKPGGEDQGRRKSTTYNPNGPGEMGKPFRTPKNLTVTDKKLVSDGWQNNAFNQWASDQISVRRRLPDPRDEWCKKTGRYSDDDVLPATSVVVCFHNEAWSVLLRTVHSVLDRSPDQLITEIILVDDFSDMHHLFEPLETYMKDYPKVKIVRATKREGLIRARLLGASQAAGPVITFLDSHIEATTGWLEPLLDRIHQDPTTVVCPVIDVIDDDTLEFHYSNSAGTSVGGFDWNLQFTWHAIPERERKKHENPSEPVASPTMAGGLFSIDKAFFEKLGTYDSGFDIWGGENLEISFKTWMCGGRLEIVPCSHVGHIFRKRSPYKWRSGVNVLRRNSVRLAKVWMDDYAQYYYQRIGNDLGDFGDVADRLKLRDELGCKNFRWFLTEIYPELFIPGEALAHGEIRNLGLGGNICLDSPATKKQTNKPVGLYPCHGQGGNQYWSYSKQGEIRRDELCVDYAGSDPMIYPCHGSLGNQHWIYDDAKGTVRHGPSRKCLAIASKDKLVMEPCEEGKMTQRWKFQNYNPGKS